MLPIWQASQARELKPLQPDETSYQPCCLLWEAAQQLSAFRYFASSYICQGMQGTDRKCPRETGDSRYNIMWAEYSQLTCGGRAVPSLTSYSAGQTATAKPRFAQMVSILVRWYSAPEPGLRLPHPRWQHRLSRPAGGQGPTRGHDLQALYPKATAPTKW